MNTLTNTVVTGVGLAVTGLADIQELIDIGPLAEVGTNEPACSSRNRRDGIDHAAHLAMVAAAAALRDAGLPAREDRTDRSSSLSEHCRIAVVASSNLGSLESTCRLADTVDTGTSRRLSPVLMPRISSNMVAGWVAISHRLQGPNLTVCNGEAGGLDALFWAGTLLAADRADAVLVVGVEPTDDIVATAYRAARQDRWLDGAAAVVVEPGQPQRTRAGKEPKATIAGYARCAGAQAAAEQALRSADVRPGPGTYLLANADAMCLPDRPTSSEMGVLDIERRLGSCSGALGVLQCALGTALITQGRTDAVLAVAGGRAPEPQARPGLLPAAALVLTKS